MTNTPPFKGVYRDMSAETYYPASPLSQSKVRWLRESAATFHYNSTHPPKDTKAMQLGRAFHQMLFQPKEKPWWTVAPKGLDGRSKEYKALKSEAEASGLTFFTYGEWESRDTMCLSAWDHTDSRQLLEGGKFEVSLFGDEPVLDGNVPIKARLDIEGVQKWNNNWLADFKSVRDAKSDAFSKTLWEHGYYMQAAFYLDLYEQVTGIRKDCFLFVAIESEPPHNLNVFQLRSQDIERGREEYKRLLALYMECQRNGEWPGYAPGIKEIGLPAWAKRKEA